MKIGAPLTKKREYLIIGLLALAVFLLGIRHIGSLGIFSVLDDEFGYWAGAAYFTGLDWSGVVYQIPYYSYGYSLLLVPLFWIFEDPVDMYKAAIILNGLMLCGIFLLSYDIAKKVMDNSNRHLLMGVSLLISLYPTLIVYSNIAWAETLMTFMVWCLAWLIVDLNNKSGYLHFVLLGCLIAYLYTIHQRTLGVFLAGLSVILIMRILNRIDWMQFLSFLVPIIAILLIHIHVKDSLQTHLWLNIGGTLTNDFSEQLSKLVQVFTLSGFMKVVKNTLGQIFYIGAATYLLGYWGIYELMRKIRLIGGKALNIGNIKTELSRDCMPLYIFILLALTFSVTISVIFMINPIRTEEIVYGRYNDILMGPLMLLGLVPFVNKTYIPKKSIGLVLVGFIFLTVTVNYFVRNQNLPDFQEIHAVGLAFMGTPLGAYLPAFIAILLGILICRSALIGAKKLLTTLMVVSICFFTTGEILAGSIVKTSSDNMGLIQLIEPLKNEKGQTPVYYLWGDYFNPLYSRWDNRNTSTRLSADCYQFILKERPLVIVNLQELKQIEGKKYLLLGDGRYLPAIRDSYEICKNSKFGYLLHSWAE